MIYPRFLKPGDRVGIPAPSAGIDESHLPEYLRSLEALRRRGWQVEETESVRSGLLPSAPPQKRAEEFNGMIRLNPTGAFLWELLEKEAEKEELVAALLSEYEIDKETAETDVDRFLSILTDNGILE